MTAQLKNAKGAENHELANADISYSESPKQQPPVALPVAETAEFLSSDSEDDDVSDENDSEDAYIAKGKGSMPAAPAKKDPPPKQNRKTKNTGAQSSSVSVPTSSSRSGQHPSTTGTSKADKSKGSLMSRLFSKSGPSSGTAKSVNSSRSTGISAPKTGAAASNGQRR